MPVFDEDIDRGVGSFVPNPDGQDGIAIAIDSTGSEDRCGTCLIESAENRFAPVAADDAPSTAEWEETVNAFKVRELREECARRGISTAGFAEKSDYRAVSADTLRFARAAERTRCAAATPQ